MSPSPIRLLIVDDDPLVLSSLRLYFGAPAAENIEVVAEASTGQDAVDILSASPPAEHIDVVMADIHMPGMDGVELLNRVRKLTDPPEFVAMTALDEEETMLSILAQGGRGYILKSSRPEFIIDTVLAAMGGGTVVSPQPASKLVQHLSGGTHAAFPGTPSPSASPSAAATPVLDEIERPEQDAESAAPELPGNHLPRLSRSEERVLALLCDGLSNSEISRETGRSASAVKKQISHLLGKFGASTRVQLAVLAVESGFHPDDAR
ncbi:MAG: response regulator [Mycobacteriaceae bacterium]